jgi:formate hydrogenlyase transcriptional activator
MVKVANNDLDAEILRALRDALEPLGVDRGGLLEVVEGSPAVKVSHIWFGEGIEPISGDLNLVEIFPWSYQHIIVQGQDKVLERLADLPPEAEVDRRSLIQMGIKSALTLPLFIGRRVHYLITVNALCAECAWPVEVIEHLRLLGEIFVSALRRRADDYALLEMKNRLDLAAASADAGLWELDLGSGVYWGSGKIREMFGYDPDQIVTREHTQKLIHPDDRDMVEAAIARAVSSRADVSVEYRAILPDGRTRCMLARGRIQEGGDGGRLRLMGITQDVTERKQMESQLQAQLQEIDRLRLQLEQENAYLRNEVASRNERRELHGFGDRMQEIMAKVDQVAGTGCTVLIEGETGTGKEVLAQIIHQRSARAQRGMVKVNCAALPAALVESELFGREKGAFTGALSRQAGRFELADGSTLFLDEIGEMPLETQVKLLRVLQEGEFERLGSPKTVKVDVRIIAASNRDLAVEVAQGRFRRDLYYRLNVFPIRLPSLCERREDIPLLAWEFVNEFGERMGKKIRRIASRDMELLKAYEWPGNIRELRNVIEHAMIVSQGETLELERLTMGVSQAAATMTLEEMERRHIRKVLELTGGRIKGAGGAAERLDINPSTLYSRMRKLGIKTVHA